MAKELKKRARRKEERPAEILDAAFEEFVKTGYAATRLEDVAARAGVTKGTIYFYFDTKERVFDEMIRHKSRDVFSEIKSATGELTGSYTARLHALITFVCQRVANDRVSRETLRFLIAEGSRFPDLVERHHDEFVEPLLKQFKALIDGGIAAGEFRPLTESRLSDIMLSPALLLTFWSMLFGNRRKINVNSFVSASIDLLTHGIAR